MHADIQPKPVEVPPRILYFVKPIALVVIIGACGGVVWTIHTGDLFTICCALIVGGSLALFTGLVVGVSLPETVITIGAWAGLFEGGIRGFTVFGWIGAVLGSALGLIAGMLAAIPVMMALLLFACLLTGTASNPAANNK